MHEPNPLIRIAQRVSDLVQDKTGMTCLRQAALLDWASAFVILASIAVSAFGGTLDGNTSRTVAIVVGAAGMAHVMRQDASDGEDPFRGLPYTTWNVTAALANHLGVIASMISIAAWIVAVAVAKHGDLTTDAAFGIAAAQAYAATLLGKRDQAFRRRFANGELTAPPAEDGRGWALALDGLVAGSLLADALAHGDAPAIVAGIAAPLIMAAALVGRCRPRPPRTRRQKSHAPSGRMATSAT